MGGCSTANKLIRLWCIFIAFCAIICSNPFYNSGNCLSRNDWFSSKDIEQKRNDIKALCIQLRREQGKNDLDIDAILDRLQITVKSQSGMRFEEYEYEEDEYEDDEDDDESEENERDHFENKVWEMDDDLLKEKLISTCKYNPALYCTLKRIVDNVDSEQMNGHS